MQTCRLTLLFFVAVLAARFAGAAEPNDDFASATILSPGIMSVTDDLEGGGLFPDTFLGAFEDDTFTPPTIAEDDDSSPLGDGLADAIFGIDVNPDGSIHLAVTGCCDDFDGTHGEEGDYELFVDVFDLGGAPIDSFSVFSTLFPGTVDEFSFDDPTWIGGTFDALIDNTVSGIGSDPLDYWVFTGLTPGDLFEAETSFPGESFDTELGWFDEFGGLITVDDDGGVELFSLIEGVVPANGEVVLAVTGYPDEDFLGVHSESGPYTLTLTIIVPEPSTLLLLATALPWLARRRRS